MPTRSESEDITPIMRPVKIAVLLTNLVLLVFLQAVDPFACPDGCADAANHHEASSPRSESSPDIGDCVLCHASLAAPRISTAAVPALNRMMRNADLQPALVSGPARRIEHPPRAA